MTLHYNELFNITSYTANNQSTYDIDASDNYWGEDTETETNDKGCDAGQDEIQWNPKADLTYDLIRGDLANLALMGGIVDLGPVSCEQQVVGSGSVIDVSPDPAPSQAWFYPLRDHVTPGNFGLDSSGRERVPASGNCP